MDHIRKSSLTAPSRLQSATSYSLGRGPPWRISSNSVSSNLPAPTRRLEVWPGHSSHRSVRNQFRCDRAWNPGSRVASVRFVISTSVYYTVAMMSRGAMHVFQWQPSHQGQSVSTFSPSKSLPPIASKAAT